MLGGGPGTPGPSQTQQRESALPVQATSQGKQLRRIPTRRYRGTDGMAATTVSAETAGAAEGLDMEVPSAESVAS